MNEVSDEVKQELAQRFRPDHMQQWFFDRLPGLVTALFLALLLWLLWRALRHAMDRVLRRAEVDDTARSFVETTLGYALGAIGTVAVLAELGVNTASLLGSLGVAGLTLGFAARDAPSNVISGIFIFLTEGTGEDLGRVQRTLLELVAGDPRYLDEPATRAPTLGPSAAIAVTRAAPGPGQRRSAVATCRWPSATTVASERPAPRSACSTHPGASRSLS
ncbi:MAG: mechanosensitive ion channel [Myxococcales bacterium]